MIKLFAFMLAAVAAATQDGEATVYVRGDFTANFDVAYKVMFTPVTANATWSSVQLMLLGLKGPSDVAAVGITHGYPTPGSIQSFTSLNGPRHKGDYRSANAPCAVTCELELRGDRNNVYALVGGRLLKTWPRSDLALHTPYIQLNTEAHKDGDHVNAIWSVVRMTAAGKALHISPCAFTSHGVEPMLLSNGNIIMTGTRRDDAPQEFIDAHTHKEGC